MGDWHIAPCLNVLRNQLKDLWPGVIIGSIGDEHHTPPSDHVPDSATGAVRALDIMLDASGHPNATDLGNLASSLTADTRTKYVIYDRRIYSDNVRGWRSYSGPNPHTDHVHISTRTLCDDLTGPWNLNAIPPPLFRRTLKLTAPLMRGGDISAVQAALGGLDKDGIYGPKTRDAVKAFQKSKGLSADGIVGPATWSVLSPLMAK